MTFKNLIPSAEILKALDELGHTTPTPIQEQAIPEILKGLDIRASAQTGSGKTGAFILPSLAKLAQPAKPGKGPRILVLVPTRELAMQVAAEANKYSKFLSRAKTVCIYGGAPYPPQNKDLARPYDILVATPGRLIDHFEQNRISFARLETFILDEADRMLDMGFIDAVEQIAAATPKDRQTLMFSATLKGTVLKLSERLLNNPIEITVAQDLTKHENIIQQLHSVDNVEHKYNLLDHLLNDSAMQLVIVFTSTKYQADLLVGKLSKGGHLAAALHGGMKQRQRTKIMMQMRRGDIRVLVATDVASRGIDVPAISHVINFDLPMSVEDYVHRIGRTGRAGASGIAMSFATYKDMHLIKRIEKFTGQKIHFQSIPGFESKMKPQSAKPSSGRPAPRRPGSRPGSRPGPGGRPGNKNRFRPSFSAKKGLKTKLRPQR